MALTKRCPTGELTHHSDRGSQYASSDYQQLLGQHQITVSMSSKGNCWDNAVRELFLEVSKQSEPKVNAAHRMSMQKMM